MCRQLINSTPCPWRLKLLVSMPTITCSVESQFGLISVTKTMMEPKNFTLLFSLLKKMRCNSQAGPFPTLPRENLTITGRKKSELPLIALAGYHSINSFRLTWSRSIWPWTRQVPKDLYLMPLLHQREEKLLTLSRHNLLDVRLLPASKEKKQQC